MHTTRRGPLAAQVDEVAIAYRIYRVTLDQSDLRWASTRAGGLTLMRLGRPRRTFLAAWIFVNALLLSALILNPMRSVPGDCLARPGKDANFRQVCYRQEESLIEPRLLLSLLVLFNGLAAAGWLLLRPTEPDQTGSG